MFRISLPSSLKRKMMVRTAKGFTLVEVVVSVVIVALTAAGIFASFIAAQNYVSRSRGRINTSNAVRQQIENMKVYVNQTTWNNAATCDPATNGLALTAPCADGWTGWEAIPGTFGGSPWNGQRRYRVTLMNPADPSGPRKTDVQINWTEPGI